MQCSDKFWWYDLPEAKDAIEEWTLQSGCDSDCILIVLKGTILSTPPSTGLRGFQFSNSSNYISNSWSERPESIDNYTWRVEAECLLFSNQLICCAKTKCDCLWDIYVWDGDSRGVVRVLIRCTNTWMCVYYNHAGALYSNGPYHPVSSSNV